MKIWSRDRRKRTSRENSPKIIICTEELMSNDGILRFFQNYLAGIQFYKSISNSFLKRLSKQEAYDEEQNNTT